MAFAGLAMHMAAGDAGDAGSHFLSEEKDASFTPISGSSGSDECRCVRTVRVYGAG